jgi:excisionase family DNA binding protein
MMLIRPRPKPDESVSTYLLRVSECNGYEGVAGLFRLARVPQGPATMHKVLTETERLPALAEAIGRPAADLLSLVYAPEKGVKLPTYAKYRDRQLPLSALRREQVCVCPECLQEDNYGRQDWDWSLFAACDRHDKLLLDRCPSCGEAIRRYRMGVSHCVCGFDFRTAETAATDTSSVATVRSILDGEPAYGNPETVLRTLTTLAGVVALSDQIEPDLSRCWATPVAQLHEGLTDACAAIKSGRIDDLVHKVVERRLALWPDLGLRGALLPFLVHQGSLKGLWNPSCLQSVDRHLRPSATSHAAPMAGMQISLGGVAAILGLSTRVVADAARHGALSPVRGPTVDGFGHWLFDAADVIALLRTLRNRVLPDETPVYDLQEIVMPRVTQGVTGWGHVLGLIRRGEVSVVAFDELTGCLSLRFQGLQISETVTSGDLLSVKDCAEAIGIYTDAIYRLIKADVLPSKKTGSRYGVRRADLEAFASSYVFVKELASNLGVNSTNLAEKLMDAGVPAVSGPRVDKGLVYLFRRADVAKVNLKEVSEKVFYSTLTGRKSDLDRCRASRSLHMKSVEVAKVLGVTVQQLSMIERAGHLKPRKIKGNLANTRLYLKSEVEIYLQTFHNNPEMLSLVQAAALLEESPSYFHRKWVRTGKLGEITDGFNCWYRRGDVEELRQEKQYLMTGLEAAKLVGGRHSTIEIWRRSGWLKAVAGPTIDGSKWYLYERSEVEKAASEVNTRREGGSAWNAAATAPAA